MVLPLEGYSRRSRNCQLALLFKIKRFLSKLKGIPQSGLSQAWLAAPEDVNSARMANSFFTIRPELNLLAIRQGFKNHGPAEFFIFFQVGTARATLGGKGRSPGHSSAQGCIKAGTNHCTKNDFSTNALPDRT